MRLSSMRKYSPCAVPGGLLLGMVATLLLQASLAHGAITGWDFQDGTLQGWTNVSVSTTGPLQYTAQTNGGDVTWLPWGYRTTDTGYMAAVEAFAVRDDAQDAPLVLRSPTFQLASGGAISVHVLGGVPGDTAITPANFSDVSGPSLNTSGEDP